MNKLLPDMSVLETFPAIILTVDLKCTILNCNAKATEYLGYSNTELVKKSIDSFLFHDKGNSFWFYLENVLSGSNDAFQIRFKKKNGEVLFVNFLLLPYFEGQDILGAYMIAPITPEQIGSVASTSDTTSKELSDIKFALDQAADITITDPNGIIIYTNDRLCKITKYERHELIGQNHRILNSNFHSKQFFTEMWRTISAGKVWRGEIRNQKKDGSHYWSDSTIVPFLDDRGIPYQYVAIRYDITTRKELEEKVRFQTYYDPLTQLPNRRMLEDMIEKELLLVNWHGKFAVYMLNVNRLSFINDTLGHNMGDKMLQAVAQRLSALAVKNDWKLGRFSGDQFCLIVSKITSDERIKPIAERIMEQFKHAFSIQDYQLYVSANIGIAAFPESGDTYQTLLKNADIALSRSREKKRGTYEIYSSLMDINAFKQLSLMNDIHNACKSKEFELYFQPILNLKAHEKLSAEALIRWNHIDWAVLAPDEFIPISEETGLIISITEWVIHEVCKQLDMWRKEAIDPIPISINLSAHDLMRKDFANIVKKIIQEYKIDSRLLKFEITERIVTNNDEIVLSSIHELKKLGISIAIDNFGAGYSSLNVLKKLPVDAVKIDKVFVEDLLANGTNFKLLKSIVQFVKEMDLESTVEGIETLEQLNKVTELDCTYIQGFLISRPIKVEELKTKFLNVDRKKLLAQYNVTQTNTDQEPKQESQKQQKNRRRFFRVDLKYPLGGHLTIQNIDKTKVNIGKSKILIRDIGPGGMRFLSNLNLPLNPNMMFEFETKILGKVIQHTGHIVWGKEYISSIYEYGLELKINEVDRSEMIKILNNLIVKLNKSPIVADCDFVTDDIKAYLK